MNEITSVKNLSKSNILYIACVISYLLYWKSLAICISESGFEGYCTHFFIQFEKKLYYSAILKYMTQAQILMNDYVNSFSYLI